MNASPVLFSLERPDLLRRLCQLLPATSGQLQSRHFPDGETYLKVVTGVDGCDCIVIAELSRPDAKFLPLVFLADTLRELGASSVGLVAPYLCYMRQDKRFQKGEALTSRLFARLLSTHFDWLVTVDPHLHRYRSLPEIYGIPTWTVTAAGALAGCLGKQAPALLVGPDAESRQWVSRIAEDSGLDYVVGAKTRFGDREVRIQLPDLSDFTAMTAIIVDDVISSGGTVLQCIEALQAQRIKRIKCAAVHGIFANAVDRTLLERGLAELITTNTIAHGSNQVDVSNLLVAPIRDLVQAMQEK